MLKLTGVLALFLIVGGGLYLTLFTSEQNTLHTFDRIRLSDTFYGEGAASGDVNGDGSTDVICGPYWYEGPEFLQRTAYYEPVEFDPLEYSDNFVVAVEDVNEDGRNDILIVGFPGQEAYWYENPESYNGPWQRHLIYPVVDNESPAFIDMTGDGRLDLLFHTDGYVGYAVADPENPSHPWTFQAISEQINRGHFTHGFGTGDLSGDGYQDIIMSDGWWENPGPSANGNLWAYHPADFGNGGAQMYSYDVDGDGLNDVITSLNAHGWGLAWFRQIQTDDTMSFERHLIMGESHDDNPYGVRFSQPHAVELIDMDSDGLQDIVSGKRFWAHGPDGDFEPNAPAVLYWFKLVREEDGSVDYIPYLIDDDSGVGTQFTGADMTGNGYPDLVTCNKNGGSVFLNRVEQVSREAWEDAQP